MTSPASEPGSDRSDTGPRAPTWREIARRKGFWIGLVAFAALALAPFFDPRIDARPARAGAVALLMAVWWLTEALPIAWTACVPVVAFPAVGAFGRGFAGDLAKSASPFADAYIFLFLGGMVIGAAMEHHGLHRRIALLVMRRVGTRPSRLLLGLLIATAGVSLWISNTATAVMMTPIAIALVRELELGQKAKLADFGCALLLGVAYASNVGGIGTKIGTGTNSIFCGFLAQRLGVDIGFLRYIAFGLPFVVLFLPIVFFALWRVARRDGDLVDRGGAERGREVLDRQIADLGRLEGGERQVAIVFAVAALFWIFGDLVRPFVEPIVKSRFDFGMQAKHYEATVAMIAAASLAIGGGLSFAALRRIPYGTLLLLGGSFAMASGIDGSGLAAWMGAQVGGIQRLPLGLQVVAATAGTVLLTAIASNTATINVALQVLPPSPPVLASTVLGSSCDFMLPAGTPPNAIVFGSGMVRLPTMIRIGALLDLAAIAVITAYVVFYGRFILPL